MDLPWIGEKIMSRYLQRSTGSLFQRNAKKNVLWLLHARQHFYDHCLLLKSCHLFHFYGLFLSIPESL